MHYFITFNDLGETLDFGDSCFLPSKMIIIDHLPKSRVDNGKELSDDRNQLSFGVNHFLIAQKLRILKSFGINS